MFERKRSLRYKGVSVGMFGLPVASGTENKNLKSNKRSRREYLQSFISDFGKEAPKDLLLIYDIPDGQKRERDWFRRQLKNFDFVMIQRSVWVGPSPLPTDFLAYLKRVGLQEKFKIFKLAKSYTKIK